LAFSPDSRSIAVEDTTFLEIYPVDPTLLDADSAAVLSREKSEGEQE